MRIAFAVVILGLVFGAPAQGAELVSCYDFAFDQKKAGASPHCAPRRIENESAFDFFKTFKAKEIGFNYYVFMSGKEWESLSKGLIWQLLDVAVSSVQVLHGKNADVFLVRGMPDRRLMSQILLSRVPEERLVARARYAWPRPQHLREAKPPPAHFDRPYILIVY